MRRAPATFVLALAACFATVATSARAGGPLHADTAGRAVGWTTRGAVPYVTDQGALGLLSNADAVTKVEDLFEVWNRIHTADVRFQRDDTTGVDVDETNFGPYLGPFGGGSAPLGESAIVFDADGAIFDLLFGVGTTVLGFASPTYFSDGATTVAVGEAVPPGAEIIEGLAFLNGKFIDGIDDPSSRNFELPMETFDAVFIHEFGHFAGLDHTQIGGMRPPADSDQPGHVTPVQTMFPILIDAGQASLERDDVVALSALYPTPDFSLTTGTITGRVVGRDGAPFSGANVIARSQSTGFDTISYVSGATVTPAGRFTIAGLTPGVSYTVEVQAIDAFFTGGSRVGPFSPPAILPGPPELWNGPRESGDPLLDDPADATSITAAAGATVADVDIVVNAQPFDVTNVRDGPGTQIQDFAVGDFDGDGAIDFVAPTVGGGGNDTRYFRGLGDGRFAPPLAIDAFPGNAFAVAAHLNAGADAFLDVAVASPSRGEVRLYRGDGGGGFAPPVPVLDALAHPAERLIDLASGDLNGDAYVDLVTIGRNPATGAGTAYALLGSASGSFALVSSALPSGSGAPFGELHVAPVTGGPAADVVGIASITPAALGLLIGDGAGGFTPMAIPIPEISARLGDFGRGIAPGDFDEDGTIDLAISNLRPPGAAPNFTRSYVDVLAGDGLGGFTLADRYTVPESFQGAIVAVDLDGDGHLDVASTDAFFARGDPGARVTIAHGDGTGAMSEPTTLWGLAEFPRVLAAADLNGDALPDLLVSDSATQPFGLDQPPHYSVLLQSRCGDGVLDPNEECDDGNRAHGDGCDGTCAITGCGNGVLTAGEECDDGNADETDGCTTACTICGNGIVSAGEDCDDGSRDAGDCCSPGCTFDPAATTCDPRALACASAGTCDGAGTCVGVPTLPTPGCRRPAVAGKALLQLKDRAPDSKDRLVWKWLAGSSTSKADFADPIATTDYDLCIYDGDARLVAAARAPAGGECRGRACWRETRKGFKYVDRDLTPTGLSKLDLREGSDAKAKLTAKGKGSNLTVPALPLTLPVRVQLRAADGLCWEALYAEPGLRRNDTRDFKAKGE